MIRLLFALRPCAGGYLIYDYRGNAMHQLERLLERAVAHRVVRRALGRKKDDTATPENEKHDCAFVVFHPMALHAATARVLHAMRAQGGLETAIDDAASGDAEREVRGVQTLLDWILAHWEAIAKIIAAVVALFS